MRNPSELTVYAQAEQVAFDVYRLTLRFPRDERFGLTQQLRRAVVSVGSNLAEGCSRESQADFRRFVEIAVGSAMETQHQLNFAYRLSRTDEFVHSYTASASAWETVRGDVNGLVRALIALAKSLRP